MAIIVMLFMGIEVLLNIGDLTSINKIKFEIYKKEIKRVELRKIQMELNESEKVKKLKIDEGFMDSLIAKYGKPTKIIDTKNYPSSPSYQVMVFEEASQILIYKKIFAMKDVLSYSIVDNSHTIHKGGVQTSNTKIDRGSMLGRAIVGGVLTGGVGAVIGAATAKRETTTTASEAIIEVKHDYTIAVNVNSITDPLVKIHIGASEEELNEITGLLNVIIHRNTQISLKK